MDEVNQPLVADEELAKEAAAEFTVVDDGCNQRDATYTLPKTLMLNLSLRITYSDMYVEFDQLDNPSISKNIK